MENWALYMMSCAPTQGYGMIYSLQAYLSKWEPGAQCSSVLGNQMWIVRILPDYGSHLVIMGV